MVVLDVWACADVAISSAPIASAAVLSSIRIRGGKLLVGCTRPFEHAEVAFGLTRSRQFETAVTSQIPWCSAQSRGLLQLRGGSGDLKFFLQTWKDYPPIRLPILISRNRISRVLFLSAVDSRPGCSAICSSLASE